MVVCRFWSAICSKCNQQSRVISAEAGDPRNGLHRRRGTTVRSHEQLRSGAAPYHEPQVRRGIQGAEGQEGMEHFMKAFRLCVKADNEGTLLRWSHEDQLHAGGQVLCRTGLFKISMRSCPHAHALPVDWSSPKNINYCSATTVRVTREMMKMTNCHTSKLDEENWPAETQWLAVAGVESVRLRRSRLLTVYVQICG